MNIMTNIMYYFNYYFPNFRALSKITAYFSTDYNKAILCLTEKGYDFYDEFESLFELYKESYCPNNEELFYINNIKFSNLRNNMNVKVNFLLKAWKSNIKEFKLDIQLYKQNLSYLELNYQYNILKTEFKILNIEYKKIKPVYEAISLRILSKKILEILINKNIQLIDVYDYIPESDTLKKYYNCLKSYYFPDLRNNKNIQNNVKALIQNIEKKNNKENKDEKIPKIIYNSNDDIVKIIKALFNLKKYCNTIVYPGENGIINFDLNEYIAGEINDKINSEEELINEYYNNSNEEFIIDNNIKGKPKIINNTKFHISKIVEYIAYGNCSNILISKLNNLSKSIRNKILRYKKEIENEKEIVIEYKNTLEEANTILKKINEELGDLLLSEKDCIPFINSCEDLVDYFNKNKASTNQIPLNLFKNNEQAQQNVLYLNDKFKHIDIYHRLLLNITFEYNIALIKLKSEIIQIIERLNSIVKIEADIKKIDCEKELQEVENKINTINNNLFIFNRKKFFVEINQNEFVMKVIGEFPKNFIIDISGKEIVDFYFYIYLLKHDLYDEKSFKMLN